jgi:hypothetical protein
MGSEHYFLTLPFISFQRCIARNVFLGGPCGDQLATDACKEAHRSFQLLCSSVWDLETLIVILKEIAELAFCNGHKGQAAAQAEQWRDIAWADGLIKTFDNDNLILPNARHYPADRTATVAVHTSVDAASNTSSLSEDAESAIRWLFKIARKQADQLQNAWALAATLFRHIARGDVTEAIDQADTLVAVLAERAGDELFEAEER